MPLTLSFVPTFAVNTLKQESSKTDFQEMISYVFQFLIARKFSDNFSLQLMPTIVHADKISFAHAVQNIAVIGIAATHRVSKRMNVNAEYYYRLNDDGSTAHNVSSFGIDLRTGGTFFNCTLPIHSE